MIQITTKKNGKKVVKSSYFADIQMLEDSFRETAAENYMPRWQHTAQNKPRDLSELSVESTVMRMQLAKKAVVELSDFVAKLPKDKVADYEINWGRAEEQVTYEDLEAKKLEYERELEITRDPAERVAIQDDIEAVTKQLAQWDHFVDSAIAQVEAPMEV